MVFVELQGGTGTGVVPVEQLLIINPKKNNVTMFLNVFMISKFFNVVYSVISIGKLICYPIF
ncbi:hypothetical protein GCM10028861_10160 [Flavobacterium koreense]